MNYRVRGFDFAFATLIFDGPTVITEDRRHDYGERRFIAIGVAEGLYLTIVYTDRKFANAPDVRRIISARLSNRSERKRYGQIIR